MKIVRDVGTLGLSWVEYNVQGAGMWRLNSVSGYRLVTSFNEKYHKRKPMHSTAFLKPLDFPN